ncbi:hypothetical protein HPB50_015190 [Hyalomma asiaticum]|uniref:Uncharacterized protein n=1 Tax=Hyalomma asiaticum TaxID=266040 RepID=A0ACB7SNS6_HYAAI|nr:hypothetical protein HPB50_015190 [Hyalomma asiaticum]
MREYNPRPAGDVGSIDDTNNHSLEIEAARGRPISGTDTSGIRAIRLPEAGRFRTTGSSRLTSGRELLALSSRKRRYGGKPQATVMPKGGGN